MTQTLLDKQAALKTLLPLLIVHLGLYEQALKISAYGDADDVRKHGPVWSTLDCDGDCKRCEWEKTCRGEWFEVVKEKLRRRYRLQAVEISLGCLEYENEGWYHAVWQFYVDPPEDDCFHLSDLCRVYADAGVEWMAREIPGELVAFGEDRCHTTKQALTLQIIHMSQQNFTQRRIAHELRCGRDRVRQTLAAVGVRCE